jgi:hypothetical protein
MSSAHVAPQLEVRINKCQSDNLNIIAADAYNNKPPSTEAYRSQQFIDITDDLEGPPPYQNGVADSFIIIRDIHHRLSSNSRKTFELSERCLYVGTDQYTGTGTGDFILFQDEVLWDDSAEHVNSSGTFSSQVSCCSDISLESSTESSPSSSAGSAAWSEASLAAALAEHQGLVLVEPSRPNIEQPHGISKSVDTSRLIDWLQNISSSSKEVRSSTSIPVDQAIISVHHCAEKNANSRD